MSVAEAMGRALQQTSISTNIKERLDYSCALFSANGDLVVSRRLPSRRLPFRLTLTLASCRAGQRTVHSSTSRIDVFCYQVSARSPRTVFEAGGCPARQLSCGRRITSPRSHRHHSRLRIPFDFFITGRRGGTARDHLLYRLPWTPRRHRRCPTGEHAQL